MMGFHPLGSGFSVAQHLAPLSIQQILEKKITFKDGLHSKNKQEM